MPDKPTMIGGSPIDPEEIKKILEETKGMFEEDKDYADDVDDDEDDYEEDEDECGDDEDCDDCEMSEDCGTAKDPVRSAEASPKKGSTALGKKIKEVITTGAEPHHVVYVKLAANSKVGTIKAALGEDNPAILTTGTTKLSMKQCKEDIDCKLGKRVEVKEDSDGNTLFRIIPDVASSFYDGVRHMFKMFLKDLPLGEISQKDLARFIYEDQGIWIGYVNGASVSYMPFCKFMDICNELLTSKGLKYLIFKICGGTDYEYVPSTIK